MNFDSLVFACVADELRRTLTGGRVEKIAQPLPLVLTVTVFTSGEKQTLSCVCDAGEARMHLVSRRGRPNPTTAPAFCMLLRKYLEGGWLQEITQPLGLSERVVRLSFRGDEGKDFHLWLEIMGKQSNVIFTNEDGMILGAIKRVTPAMSRLREIRAGIRYIPPPKQLGGRRDPFDPASGAALPDQTFATPGDAGSWLMATFRGVSTGMATEAVARAQGELTAERVWYGLNDLLNSVRLNEYAPVVWREENGTIGGVSPVPLRSVSSERQERWKTISAALEFAYETKESTDTLTQEKTSLLAAIRRTLKAREREYLDVQEGLLYSDRATELKESADLLRANQHSIAKGATQVVVQDYFSQEQGATRTIALDEKLSVSENVERYIKKFRKARDSRATLETRQSAVIAAIAILEQVLPEAEAAQTAGELMRLTERISTILPKSGSDAPGTDRKAEPSPFEGHKIKTYRSPDGWEVLVGENATSNDFLTTRIASPSDIWLHARAVTSAHGIIRARNRPASVSTAAIHLAAEQVARRSHAKHARLVAVDYTLKKYVRKPRGAEPGQVLYTNEKTLDVVLED